MTIKNKAHELQQAILNLVQACNQTPEDPSLHHRLARAYEYQGDIQQSLTHYQAALHAAPDFILAHEHLGQLFLKTKQHDAARTQFNNVLALNPEHTEAHFYLGVIALLEEHLEQAKQAFESVLLTQKDHTDALTNLGVIALKQNKNQQAITYFSEALARDESLENARNNLAATFMHHDRFENARTHYLILLETHPCNLEYHYNLGVAEMALGHLDEARKHFNHVLKQDAEHHASLTNLASIASRLNQPEDAIHYLKRAHQVNPNDTSSQFMLDAFSQTTPTRHASTAYTQNLFDNYAIHYEKHMSETLSYAVPKHMAQLLHQLIPNSTLTSKEHPLCVTNALDLGCGTGLSGIILRDMSLNLTGVDLSAKMLTHAKEKAIYDVLIEDELMHFLEHQSTAYDLITAADVLPYLSDLNPLFTHIKKTLVPQGLFLLTHEITEQTDWTLQKTARFAHHPNYIRMLAAQHELKIVHHASHIARQHHNEDLPVMLYALQSV